MVIAIGYQQTASEPGSDKETVGVLYARLDMLDHITTGQELTEKSTADTVKQSNITTGNYSP